MQEAKNQILLKEKVDNVIMCGPIFKINSLVEWSKKQLAEGKIDHEQYRDFISLARSILTGQNDLLWKEGVPHIIRTPKRLTSDEDS